jgi:glycosyltransferase involved in cell wall biosynthesis
MLFSIIIPTLNEEIYIPHLLNSLSEQTYKEFEVIIVDAFSEDKTISLIKQFSPLLPSLTILEVKKKNVAFQRNLGAKHAQGEFFIFLDADVLLPKNFLKSIKKQIAKRHAVLLTTWIKPDVNRKIYKTFAMALNLSLEIVNAIDKPFTPGHEIIVKSDVFSKIKFNETIFGSEDHDFSLRAKKAGIDLCVLRTPVLTASMRRFQSQGILSTLRKHMYGYFNTLIFGPGEKKLYDYPMGGHVHTIEKTKKHSWTNKQLTQFLKQIKSVHTTITKINTKI